MLEIKLIDPTLEDLVKIGRLLDVDIQIGIEAPEPLELVDSAAPDVDSAGYPWDERIHASSKARIADGTWRLKRGVDDPLVQQIRAEYSKPALSSAPTIPEALRPAASVPPAPTEAPNAPVTAPVPPSAADAALTFPALMKRITTAGIQQAQVAAVVTQFGLAGVTDLMKPDNAAYLPMVAEALGIN